MHNKILFSALIISISLFSLTNCRHQEKVAALEMMFALRERKYEPTHEGFYRKTLYKMAKDNPHFYKMSPIKKNREYYVDILKDHIIKLEDKIAQNKNGIISWSTAKGTFSLSLTALCALAFRYFYFAPGFESNEKGNYNYLNHQWNEEKTSGLIGFGLSTLGCGFFTGYFFKKVIQYKERLHERLKRDQELLKLLEE